MLFCGIELAARIEQAECRLVTDACANVARRLDNVLAMPISGGIAAFTEPNSPLNKVAGLGFGGAFDETAFARVESEHAARNAPVQVELATLADPSFAKALTQRGYLLVGVENVLGLRLPLETRAKTRSELQIARSNRAELDEWMDVMVTGFASADAQGIAAHEEFPRAVIEGVMRDFAGAEGVVRYLARRDGMPVGAGTMRMFGGVAQLCGAATLPAHRRRGVQSALLLRRLAEASDDGCTVAVVTTQPGSKSQENVQRQGFELLYSRNVLRREPR